MCHCSVFAATVLLMARQTATALQSVSELIQNGFKFRLTFQVHKSTFFLPEEAAPWLCKNTAASIWFGGPGDDATASPAL